MKRCFAATATLAALLLATPASPRAQELVFSTIEGSPDVEVVVAVLREAYARLGIDIVVQRLPANEALRRSSSGEVDGEVSRIDGVARDYPNLIQVPVPVGYIQGAVFSRDVDLHLAGWHSLRPYRVGRVSGVLFAERGTRGFDTIVAEDYQELIDLLLADRVDLIVAPYINGRVAIRNHPDGAELKLNGIIETFLLYHYLHARHADRATAVAEVLKSMLRDGTMREIFDRTVASLVGESP